MAETIYDQVDAEAQHDWLGSDERLDDRRPTWAEVQRWSAEDYEFDDLASRAESGEYWPADG